MIVCNSGGSNPANDASRWREDDPLEAKAITSACLEYGAGLEKAAPIMPVEFGKTSP